MTASYFLPRSVPEALALLDTHGPSLLVMAGGTVAMPLINEGISLPEAVMGLRHVGLDRIERDGATLNIGATATLTQLLAQRDVPLLSEAARSTASWSVRNLATVGGNLFTPPPGGDVAVALLALDATVDLAEARSIRTLALEDFYTGFMTTRMTASELLTGLHVPIADDGSVFIKFGRKRANTPAVVAVAARVTWEGAIVAGARIALGAVGPHPIRAHDAEAILVGTSLDPGSIAAAAARAAEACEPFTDAIATDWYRRRMVGVHVGRALERLAGRGHGEERQS